MFLAAYAQLGRAVTGAEIELERDLHFGWLFQERILGAADKRANDISVSLHLYLGAAGVNLPGPIARRVMSERALRAPEVGNAHCREHHAVEFFRRKCDGNPYHVGEYAALAENAPERLTLAQQTNLGLAQRDGVFPER